MNVSLQVGMIDLAKQVGVLHQKHQYAAPPAGTGVPMATLAFTRLRMLAGEGAGSNLTVRQSFYEQAPEKSGSMRKRAPNAEGQRSAHTQGLAGDGGGGGSTLKARVLEQGTPPGVCDLHGARYVPGGKLHVFSPPSRRNRSVGHRAAATAPCTALAAASAALGAAAPAAAVSGGCSSRWRDGRRKGGSVMAAERRTFKQKLRGRRLGRCVLRGRSGPGERQQLTIRALPSGRVHRRGGSGDRRINSFRRRQVAMGMIHAPTPESVSPAFFKVGVRYRETESVNQAADRLRERPGSRPCGKKKN